MKLIKTAVDPLSRGVKFKKFRVPDSKSPFERSWAKPEKVLLSESQPGSESVGGPLDGGVRSSSEVVAEAGVSSLQGQRVTRRGRRLIISSELNQDQWIYYGTAVMTLFLGLALAFFSNHHGGSKPVDPLPTSGSLTK
ncbi:MAG: hypothetical protein JNM39_07675 [Bdellovibrionaceae bacterium]|nr:hypothetical protein [Pseudobdellovibrionaceae bacterium]